MLELPILSTSYDTFTVAAMINRAIYDQLIKRDCARGRYFDARRSDSDAVP